MTLLDQPTFLISQMLDRLVRMQAGRDSESAHGGHRGRCDFLDGQHFLVRIDPAAAAPMPQLPKFLQVQALRVQALRVRALRVQALASEV